MAYDPNDEDTKKALKEAVDAAVDAAKEGLEAKNKQLLNELKEAKKGKAIDPAEVERLEGKVDDLQAKLTAAEKASRDAEKARDKAAKDLETERGFTQRLLVQDGLKSELLKNGVKDEDFIDSLTAKFAPGASIVTEGEARKVMLGEKDLATAIKEWAGSDAGKKFVAAPNNAGGGAPGGKGSEGVKTMTRAEHDQLATSDPAAAAKFFKEGGKLVDQAA